MLEDSPAAYERDARFYRRVIFWLGSTIIVSIIAIAEIILAGKPVPDGLIALESAAVGAMADLFK